MGFRHWETRCITQLLSLYRLTATQPAQCAALRREAGRC